MSQQQLKIVFCITCKGRAHHIKRTLPQNLIDNADYENVKFVIVNYNSQDNLMEYLQTEQADNIANGKIVVYSVKDVTTFRMAHAKNIAHRLGIIEGADILVNLDADNLTNLGFATYINQQFHTFGSEGFLWAKMIKGVLPRGISGRIVVTKNQFLNVGGYDERYETWSRDDKDFNERLCRAGYIPVEIPPKFLQGIRHDDKLRFKEYPHVRPSADHYEDPTSPPNTNTIVNWGVFGCCTCTRNFNEELIVLGPIPTRIFGIGMHKTGTTSLYKAFKILGYPSGHWKTPKWAKTIWREMNEFHKSLTLEHYYALSDLPMTLLYKKLDVSYPGSKFILTIRNEQDWIESVRKHWSFDHNKFRTSWETDWFTHRIHKQLYGQIEFNAEVFLERYRRHNAEVIEYFKDRPNDLHVQYVDRNITWNSLCEFLDEPIPNVPYPNMNRTIDNKPK